ncbi:hypothetical protein MJG53_014329 [Ovis ammon polii x Ovis aries]|uniref:Uncharacterized protein n=2 Tax=Ovis TaxID=9935 RepID=A0A835ZRG5_SHEEP|nr:hypothetical protein JEQ12_007202 [Ovis aries]KAI4568711.1 hypothetical protein MJG53_014329 [Ovis ammon polii x Ovis aries]
MAKPRLQGSGHRCGRQGRRDADERARRHSQGYGSKTETERKSCQSLGRWENMRPMSSDGLRGEETQVISFVISLEPLYLPNPYSSGVAPQATAQPAQGARTSQGCSAVPQWPGRSSACIVEGCCCH